jgi:hypothetical protein
MHALALTLFVMFSSGSPEREVTPSGAFIDRHPVGMGMYTLSWGNVIFTRSLPDTFSRGPFDDPRFLWENPQYLCLRAECGPDCWYAVMLPMDPDGSVVFYTRPLAYDTVNSIVAFPGTADTLVTFEDVATGAQRSLVTWDRCGNEENYTCIRGILFDPLRLEATVGWYASGSPDHPEPYSTERSMRISLRW